MRAFPDRRDRQFSVIIFLKDINPESDFIKLKSPVFLLETGGRGITGAINYDTLLRNQMLYSFASSVDIIKTTREILWGGD